MLRGDAMRLQQVLINLGGNAVKFTSEGQVVLSLRKLAQTEHTATVEFAVRDTGIGIAPEHQAHIFDGFSQAEGSTTRRFGGTGLGLAISKRFVELMGGTIKVTSELGVGSTFTCTLDMPTVNAAEIQAPFPSDPNGTPQRVLVVDDNPIAAELTLSMVRSWGWTADLAKSGKEAIEHLSAQCATAIAEFPYPVIYMDWKMPGMDGWETTRQIRQLSERSRLPHPTVIMLTAHGLETLTHRSEAEQELINGYLVKPATASMLYDAWMDAQAGKAGIRKTSKGRSSTRQLQGMRILVVEDNLINQQVAEELLNAEGATVSLAANGQLGVDAVAAAAPQFDVVLMDVQMPVLDGYGATRAIREDLQLQYLPIVAMTANVMASDRDACLAAGMNEHIGKPFDMAKLVSLLIRMTGLQPQMLETPASALISTEPTELPVIPGLALDAAVRRMSGMRFLYIRTAESFAKALDTEVSEIRRDIEAGNTQMVKMRLHTLKGNAVTLGTNELALKAGLLEKVCQSPSGFEECAASLDDLGELCQSAKRLLLRAISELETGVISPEKIRAGVDVAPSDDSAMSNEAAGTLVSRLQALNGLLSNDDLSAVEMFAEIRSEFPDSMYGRVETLEHAIQSLDLEAAQKHANELIAFLTATH
ncbi:MAG: response regulator [Burkholderiales bacterium]|nr:response regulator [Burkholderiales bacterium]